MCGIAGALTTRQHLDVHGLVERIVESQIARGPDAQIVSSYRANDFRLALGHDRLSIIDLSAEANQPMTNVSGNLHIVFNGEIYNYLEIRAELQAKGVQFITQSDTEVILEAYRNWGTATFDRFIGMFAIAIFDSTIGELVLVRDRFGVKPLYYWAESHTIAFASTPTVIAAWARLEPNIEYLSRGIQYKYYEDDTDISPYCGVKALEPAHFARITVSNGLVTTTKKMYYDLRSRVDVVQTMIAGANEERLEATLMDTLRSACLLRQRSDVPVGLSVSGGMDSSAIASILSETLNGVIGYSFSHPDDKYSEGPLVADLAKGTGIQPRYVWPTEGAEINKLFWRTLKAQDSPFPHSSVMAQHAVFQAARADGIKVLLGGQGGDEAFMGYRKFFLFYALSIARNPRISSLTHFIGAVLPLVPAIARRAGVFLPERRRYAGTGTGMGTRLLLPPLSNVAHMGLPKGLGTAERQILDVTRFSLPTLLRYEDRNSMGNSVESRLPFLDHRVIEFGVALSERMKLRNGFGKWILRKAMVSKVPDSIRLNRDKRGFDVNQKRWIALGLGQELRNALLERRVSISRWLPKGDGIDALFSDELLSGHPQAFKEAVSLIWLGDRSI